MIPSPGRVALVHYWLISCRGGERVLEQLARLFPSADIFTLVSSRTIADALLPGRRIFTSYLDRLPGARRFHRHLLPLYPRALEEFDLTSYDLVISSESGPAKGVLTAPDTLHICYCHSPMRYLWDQYPHYRDSVGPVTRAVMGPVFHRLRIWDVITAARVDAFVANSHNVRRRIAKYYRRTAEVVYPPVRTQAFQSSAVPEDFYLSVGQLASYKRIDLALEAFRQSGRRLVVVGDGPERRRLQRRAPRNVEFLGPQPDDAVASLMGRCRAFIFPGEEDFGIAPVEAMAAGRPVVAYGRGGALESVRDGATGTLFNTPTAEALNAAIRRLDELEPHWDAEAARRHAQQFDEAVFRERMAAFVERQFARWQWRPTGAVRG